MTEVGYAGGEKASPTYHSLGAHAEVVRVEFDPTRASFEDFLALFWRGHDPTRQGRGSQYRSILLCENEDQYSKARASAAQVEKRRGRKVHTEIVLGKPFYAAEGYHQKWKLRQRRELFAEVAKGFATEEALLQSFTATKLNAIAGGHMSQADIDDVAERLKLKGSAWQLLQCRSGERSRRSF